MNLGEVRKRDFLKAAALPVRNSGFRKPVAVVGAGLDLGEDERVVVSGDYVDAACGVGARKGEKAKPERALSFQKSGISNCLMKSFRRLAGKMRLKATIRVSGMCWGKPARRSNMGNS